MSPPTPSPTEGRFLERGQAVEQGRRLAEEGADILDIGGESTRPGSKPLPEEEEVRRVIPVIEELSAKISIPISIDTRKAWVAERALEAGAEMINDVTALRYDEKMAGLVARYKVPVVLMHMRGQPETMQANTALCRPDGGNSRILQGTHSLRRDPGNPERTDHP